jgi:hypothetical protein
MLKAMHEAMVAAAVAEKKRRSLGKKPGGKNWT